MSLSPLPLRPLATGAAVAAAALLLIGCTSWPTNSPGSPSPRLQLAAFTSCDEMLGGLRSAAKAYVGPGGFSQRDLLAGGRAAPVPALTSTEDAAGAPGATDHSRTNTHEAGVDEPDLVKTDGRRIVTVLHGVLRVVDPATRRITGELALDTDPGHLPWSQGNLLLHGDRALVLLHPTGWDGPLAVEGPGVEGGRPGPDHAPEPIAGPRLILVDLAATPRIISEYRIDGGLVDARQVGAAARVVIRSAPRLAFPSPERADDAQRVTANRSIIDAAGADDWLPRFTLTSDGGTSTGRIGCDQVRRPPTYSGTSMVTLLSFDLTQANLGDGDPVTVVADGDTVYSNGRHLYVANDQRWRIMPMVAARGAAPRPGDQVTELYQFDISGPGRPRYVTATSVPGWLINQYALSEWDGHLRVATTIGQTWGDNPTSSSGVYVFRADGKRLHATGQVTGLGKGEQIYAVRFIGGLGYVVTFRQTDPLYTVDLRDPAAPRVTGELKITGYSAYLHPISDGRLLGIGQEASTQGRIEGAQISLFDVTDPARPDRLAQHHVRNSHSEAEFDPHAFLYWPDTQLLVVPLVVHPTGSMGTKPPLSGALALRVNGDKLSELGLLTHPEIESYAATGTLAIRRSLVVGETLWTLSDAGLQGVDLATLQPLAWLPLT